MDQAKNDVSQTAAFARRVVCRTLTVVGGVAAGTVVAWWLSTAPASADTLTPPGGEQVQHVVAGLGGLAVPSAAPVESAVGAVARDLPAPPPGRAGRLADPLRDLGGTVLVAAETFRGHLPGCVGCIGGNPDDGNLNDNAPSHTSPWDAGARSDLPAASVLPPAAALAPGTVPDTTAQRTAKDRAIAGGLSRRGSPEADAAARPGSPRAPAPLPFAPAGVPATGGHAGAGGPADTHVFAALPWQDSTSGLTRGDAAVVRDVVTSCRPGAAPGIAPD